MNPPLQISPRPPTPAPHRHRPSAPRRRGVRSWPLSHRSATASSSQLARRRRQRTAATPAPPATRDPERRSRRHLRQGARSPAGASPEPEGRGGLEAEAGRPASAESQGGGGAITPRAGGDAARGGATRRRAVHVHCHERKALHRRALPRVPPRRRAVRARRRTGCRQHRAPLPRPQRLGRTTSFRRPPPARSQGGACAIRRDAGRGCEAGGRSGNGGSWNSRAAAPKRPPGSGPRTVVRGRPVRDGDGRRQGSRRR